MDQDVQALLDEEVVVEDDETEGERQHVVAGSDTEKVAQAFLEDGRSVSQSVSQSVSWQAGGVWCLVLFETAARAKTNRTLCEMDEGVEEGTGGTEAGMGDCHLRTHQALHLLLVDGTHWCREHRDGTTPGFGS